MFPEILYELFSGNPRQGPGSNEFTCRAYHMCKGLPSIPEILDVGCGSGMQTLELARISGGRITALDNHQPLLDTVIMHAKAEGLDNKILTVNGSMFKLPFDKNTFDLIWSEGAIYIMGFEKGLREWKPLLKKEGYIVVSEITFIRPDIPKELQEYWETEYPSIQYIKDNQEIIRQAGYWDIGNIILPESAWLNDFYSPLKKRLDLFKSRYAWDIEAMKILDTCQQEIDIFNKYSSYYSYVFYVMQLR